MKVRYTSIYKLSGANKLPNENTDAAVLVLKDPSISATLKMDSEPDFFHVDRSFAIAKVSLNSMFGGALSGTPLERIAAEMEREKERRVQMKGKGVSLVFHGETEVKDPDLRGRVDVEDFTACLDAVDKSVIKGSFRPSMQRVLAALALTLPQNADSRMRKIGDVVYLVDPENGKPIYTFTFTGSGRASVASPVTASIVAEVARIVSELGQDTTMARPVALLTTSIDDATDPLQGFIAAWSALEIFVHVTFKKRYEAQWFRIMEAGSPNSAKPVFGRIEEVMRDKYRLADKFLILASILDAEAAIGDDKEFRRLKKVRDELLHGLDNPTSTLPTESIQRLLFKYMKLHLD